MNEYIAEKGLQKYEISKIVFPSKQIQTCLHYLHVNAKYIDTVLLLYCHYRLVIGSVRQVSCFRIKWLSVQSMSCTGDTPPDVIDQMTDQLHENLFSSLHPNSSMFKKILVPGVAEHIQSCMLLPSS